MTSSQPLSISLLVDLASRDATRPAYTEEDEHYICLFIICVKVYCLVLLFANVNIVFIFCLLNCSCYVYC